MKRNQVNEILEEETKRKHNIFYSCCIIILVLAISLAFAYLFYTKNKGYFVKYKEDSNIDYKVYLQNNDFFERNYLEEDNRYIASLIDYINATFNYKISLEEKDVEFKYSYFLESEVNVVESTGSKPLYNKKAELLKKENLSTNGKRIVEIKENLDIKYNEYNDLIKKFVAIYGLDDITSTLTINMHIKVDGSCTEFENDTNNESVISLVIPLTTKTVGIDIKNNIIEGNENIMICKDKTLFTYTYLGLSIVSFIVFLVLVVQLVKYIIDTRTAQTIYDRELNKILSHYHSYIQKVSNKVSIFEQSGMQIDSDTIYKNCQVFRLESFTDMLEIRDNLNSPILMSTNEKNTKTYFFILNSINKAVYVYGIKVQEIRKQLKKKEL